MQQLSTATKFSALPRQCPARTARIQGVTGESAVFVKLNLDGQGITDVETGMPCYTNMIAEFGRHGCFDLHVRARTSPGSSAQRCAADTAHALGQAVRDALGGTRIQRRSGAVLVPVDEAMCWVSMNLVGPPRLALTELPEGTLIGGRSVVTRHLWESFTAGARLSLGIHMLAGHHAVHVGECQFKGVAQALRDAMGAD
jgi:imidazoleglycerol-phosphate dehydratase